MLQLNAMVVIKLLKERCADNHNVTVVRKVMIKWYKTQKSDFQASQFKQRHLESWYFFFLISWIDMVPSAPSLDNVVKKVFWNQIPNFRHIQSRYMPCKRFEPKFDTDFQKQQRTCSTKLKRKTVNWLCNNLNSQYYNNM